MDKETHDKEHDSIYNPISGCEHCALEVFRRTHKCFGNGSSTIPLPVEPNKDAT